MATDLPPSLKPVQKYLIKAREVEKVEPVVSYYCTSGGSLFFRSLSLSASTCRVGRASLCQFTHTVRSVGRSACATLSPVGLCYAVELGLQVRDKADPRASKFLGSLMDQMEAMKRSVGGQLGDAGRSHLENFIMGLFQKADEIDRAGLADKLRLSAVSVGPRSGGESLLRRVGGGRGSAPMGD